MQKGLNRRLPMVDAQRFSMVPRSDVPRSSFQTQHTLKTTFDVDLLVPIYVDEVLPGDVHQGDVSFFCRLATPIFPIMDNLCIETFFFFVPNRLVWTNWVRMMGEQDDPADSIDFTIPQVVSAAGGFPILTIFDYMGLPTAGQVDVAGTVSVNALPLRAYNLIWNEWFRDENLSGPAVENSDDGPDAVGDFNLLDRNKRHDYFTSCLPWPLKGGVDVSIPLGTSAPVVKDPNTNAGIPTFFEVGQSLTHALRTGAGPGSNLAVQSQGSNVGSTQLEWETPALMADLSAVTAATINALRLAVTTQQLLEKDARGGTRYTELLRSHFGVMPEDYRLQRPEYIGGGKSYLKTQAIPQTSATDISGSTSPIGSLSAAVVGSDGHPFRYHAKEHGYILGLVNVTGDVTYQQGLHRMWTRSTRYDFYWPVFANLGEQAVRQDEIFCDGTAQDTTVFGYQERWAEYRHRPSRITGLFKSTSAGNIDEWHLAEEFATAPALNYAFLAQATPLARVVAAGAAADGVQILWDSVFNVRSTRAIPTHSVPGLSRF